MEITKYCNKCQKDVELSQFYSSSKDGYQSYCKSCKKLAKKDNGSDQRYYLKTRVLKPKKPNVYRGREKEYKAAWYLRNKKRLKAKPVDLGKRRQKGRESYLRHKKARLEYQRLRRANPKNKQKLLQYGKRWSEKQKKNNPTYIVTVRMRARLRSVLKYGSSKGAFRHLSYSGDDLKKHLESRFLDGMNWTNSFLWNIDHVVPLKYKNPDGSYYFDQKELADPTSETFRKAWALDNLQPLWKELDNAKNNRRIGV